MSHAVPMEDGTWATEKVAHVVELIREYDHRLDVAWIPPGQRGPDDPAYAILERLSDGQTVVAFYVQDESFMDERLLERIYMGDNTKHDVQARMEAQNRAAESLRRKQIEDRYAEQLDLLQFAAKSNLHTIRHNGKKIIK